MSIKLALALGLSLMAACPARADEFDVAATLAIADVQCGFGTQKALAIAMLRLAKKRGITYRDVQSIVINRIPALAVAYEQTSLANKRALCRDARPLRD